SPAPSPSAARPCASRSERSRTSGQESRSSPWTSPPPSAASSIEVTGATPVCTCSAIVLHPCRDGCRCVFEGGLGIGVAVDRLHQRTRLQKRLLVLRLGVRLHDDRPA